MKKHVTLSRTLGARKALEAKSAVWFMEIRGGSRVEREVSSAEAAASISGNPGMRVKVQLSNSDHTATCRLPNGDRFGYRLLF